MMDAQRVVLAVGLAATLLIAGAASILLMKDTSNNPESRYGMIDPLLDSEEHDYRYSWQNRAVRTYGNILTYFNLTNS